MTRALSIAIVLFLAGTACTETPDFKPRVVIPRSFPPIKDAPVVSATEAANTIGADELVLGVVVDGHARAYPINMLTGPRREIINDNLGGTAIACTW